MTRISRLHPIELSSCAGGKLFFLVFLLLTSCRTDSLPSVNLDEPGWIVRHGQAVWHPRGKATEIAGDILLATRPGGDAFTQFSKSPLTLATVQQSVHGWSAEFPAMSRHYSGHGRPPDHVVWFILIQAVLGSSPPAPWTWKQLNDGQWRLENPVTGESVEGYFSS